MATTITSQVLDSANKPISFANVTLVDLDGNTIKVAQGADVNGKFGVKSDLVPLWDDVYVEISGVGYKSMSYIPEQIPAKVILEKDEKVIGGVSVTGIKKKLKKANYLLPAILGSAALISLGVFFYKKYA